MEREARRLLRTADQEERKIAGRARQIETLKAEIEIHETTLRLLARDLDAGAIDLESIETRIAALAEVLERVRRGVEPLAGRGEGSITARIAAARNQAVEARAAESPPAAPAGLEAPAGAPGTPPAPATRNPPPVLLRARFDPETAGPADVVVLSCEAPGFGDGEDVEVEIYDLARATRLATAGGTVARERLRLELALPTEAAGEAGVVARVRAGAAEAWSTALEIRVRS
jgi:hypothetical protein